MTRIFATILAVLVLAFPGLGRAQRAMEDGSITAAWPGAVEYCERGGCPGYSLSGYRVPELTPRRMFELQSVQSEVELTFDETSDDEQYGEDYWVRVGLLGAGDCEDFALEKRARLIALGWPPQSLRLAMLRITDRKFLGHAVLTVDTDQGTFVLDNLSKNVYAWQSKTNYWWVMRESASHRHWVRVR